MESTHDEEARQKEFGLTPRELKIVSAVVAGYSNKEIAEYFKISEDTVKHHLNNIFDKLGVSSRLDLALFAVNQGLPLNPLELKRRPSPKASKASEKLYRALPATDWKVLPRGEMEMPALMPLA